MTLKEDYALLGGSFDDVAGRLGGEDRVARYDKMFLADESWQNLHAFLDAGDIDEAFRMAHTMKGTSQMLGFGNLYESVQVLTESLRHHELDHVDEQLAAVDADYAQVVAVLEKL